VIATDGKTKRFVLTNNMFDASGLIAGSYFIEAITGGKLIRTQFVKY
jgi:hypothetical protein